MYYLNFYEIEPALLELVSGYMQISSAHSLSHTLEQPGSDLLILSN